MERSWSSRKRVVLDLRSKGILSIPMFGRYNYARAMPGLESHRHPGSIEVCYLVRGQQTYIVGETRFHLRGGDVFMTFPGEVHGTGEQPQEKGQLYWIILRDPSETKNSLLGLDPAQTKALWRALSIIQNRHFPGRKEMKVHLDEAIHVAQARWSTFSQIRVTNRLISFLLSIITAHQNAMETDREKRFRPVFDYIESKLEQPDELTVETLAKRAGLSTSRFKTLFKQETGIPPAEFALRARINEAVRRLEKGGATVTEVAFGLGFSSSQYFASVFQRFTNMRPSDCLRRSCSRHQRL